MAKQHWLVKSEPEAYAWADLVRDRRTEWTGVRNYQARIHLNAMRTGDSVCFYESVTTKAIVGLARLTRPAAPDPTAEEPGWVSVELTAVNPLARPVTLAAVKADPAFADFGLLRQSRLSVMPVTPAQFARIVTLGG
ncbi:MAG: EVE domain-containing protein [Opitutales bacterium]